MAVRLSTELYRHVLARASSFRSARRQTSALRAQRTTRHSVWSDAVTSSSLRREDITENSRPMRLMSGLVDDSINQISVLIVQSYLPGGAHILYHAKLGYLSFTFKTGDWQI